MAAHESPLRELSSWKEIAAYLGVSVRTAQMWEQERGLPVRRLPGGRAQVRAHCAALDHWKNSGVPRAGEEIGVAVALDGPEGGGTNEGVVNPNATQPKLRVPAQEASIRELGAAVPSAANGAPSVVIDDDLPVVVDLVGAGALVGDAVAPSMVSHARAVGSWGSRHVLLAGLFLVVLSLSSVVWWVFGRVVVPSSYRLEGNALVITDAGGRVLWRKAFAGIVQPGSAASPIAWFGDLDGDGRTEVLFSLATGLPGTGSTLLCYSHDGVERWRFVPGRAVRTRDQEFLPPFGILGFAVARVGHEMGLRVVVVSQHHLYYPSQVALLGSDGSLLREYWHSGGLRFPTVFDLGGGVSRIVAGGVHNATKQATVLVLDPDTMGGASVEENASYQLLGFSPGVAVARLLFPRSCLNELLEPFATVGSLSRAQGEITVEVYHRLTQNVGASVFYHFSDDLGLRRMVVGSSFERSHEELAATGVLDHALSPTEIVGLQNITRLSTDATK